MVTAVWGKAYIEGFLKLSMLSSLAPGNLPALAKEADVEYVILTAEANVRVFQNSPQYKRLKSVVDVKFVFIDDLIVKQIYGVVLTLAYFRAIKSMGEEARNIYFIFMNSDFVLADGSLRSLIPHFKRGVNVVLAPSFRASEEAVLPLLREAVDVENSVLAIPPRQLVDMALIFQHPTVIAKTLNQSFLKSLYPNNLYWRVGNTTMLGHYFLLFMLVIRPTRLPEQAVCFCDYSFVPEFCPGAEATVLTDSDEFFLLETQNASYEWMYIAPGKNDIETAVTTVRDWSTEEHRRYSSHTLVFHSAELPANLDEEREKFAAVHGRIMEQLGRTPACDHRNHYYWCGAVAAWLREKTANLSTSYVEIYKSLSSVLSPEGARGKRKGLLPRLARWLERRLCLGQLDSRSAFVRRIPVEDFLRRGVSEGTMLYACDDYFLDAELYPHAKHVDKAFCASMTGPLGKGSQRYRHAVCVLTNLNLEQGERIMRGVVERLVPGGEALLLYRRDTALTSSFQPGQLEAHHLERICGVPLADRRVWVAAGNNLLSRLMFTFARCVGKVRGKHPLAILGACALAPVAVFVYPMMLERIRENGSLTYNVMALCMHGRKPAAPMGNFSAD